MKFLPERRKLVHWGLLLITLTTAGCRGSGTPATLRPSAILFPTAMLTVTSTVEPTVAVPPTVVWTPLPTLSPEEAEIQVLDLLQHNAGCRLPCWWGITPGETSVSTAIQFLSSFTHLWTVLGTPGNESSVDVEQGASINSMVSSYRVFGNYGSVDYTFRDGVIDTIYAYHGGGTGDRRAEVYQLSRILDSYGNPDEIWFSAAPNSPLGNTADLYLFYGQQGIFVHYVYQNLVVSADKMEVCPHGVGPEELYLWSPSTYQIATFQDYFGYPISWPPIETSLGVDQDTFYQTFKGNSYNTCINTPTRLWEYPSPIATP